MRAPKWRLLLTLVSVAVVLLVAMREAASQLASAGAGGLLHPARHRVVGPPPPTCQDAIFAGEGVNLRGWRCRASAIGPGPILLVGTSLGAAVALQEAAQDIRVTAVVAAETFSDLRTVATERAPFFFTSGVIERALLLAEQQGRFQVDAVSPVLAAAEIKIPVLLIHGTADSETPPEHSRRVLAALAGPKHLILVPGARHNEALSGEVWDEVDHWLDGVVGPVPRS